MTAKENFYSEIKRYNAKRIESITNAEVYASMVDHTVFIFSHPDCEHYDKFDCGNYFSTLMIPQVMRWAFREKDNMPDRIMTTLNEFYSEFTINKDDAVDAVVWLCCNTGAFDDIWDKHGLCHVEYEDDTEPMTPDEYRSHEQFFGEVFLVMRELNRVFCHHFHKDSIARFASYDIRQSLYETRAAFYQIVGCMLDDRGLITDNYRTNNPEDMWACGAHSLEQRIEACYWLLSSVKRDMDEEMDKNEDAYAFADQRVQSEIYKFCEKTMKEIEELRGMENADI